jgi:hypothetical protein
VWYTSVTPMSRSTATILVTLLYLLHQDFWFWTDAEPLVFGVLPVGLFYHVAYTLVTAFVLWVLVRRFWPAHLDPGTSDE